MCFWYRAGMCKCSYSHTHTPLLQNGLQLINCTWDVVTIQSQFSFHLWLCSKKIKIKSDLGMICQLKYTNKDRFKSECEYIKLCLYIFTLFQKKYRDGWGFVKSLSLLYLSLFVYFMECHSYISSFFPSLMISRVSKGDSDVAYYDAKWD